MSYNIKNTTRFATLVVAVLSIVLVGCESSPSSIAPSDSKTVSAQNEAVFSDPYDAGGQMHNDALDYAIVRLVESGETFTLDEVKAFMEDKIRDYDRLTIEETEPSVEFEILKISSAKVNQESVFSETVPDSILARVDDETVGYLDQISGLLDGSRSADEVDYELQQLEESAASSLHDEGAEIVLSASAVARHSTRYWEDRLADWVDIVGSVLESDDGPYYTLPGVPKYDYWATAVCLISANGSKHCFPAGAVRSMEAGVDYSSNEMR